MKRAIAIAGVALAAIMGANAYAFTIGIVDVQRVLSSDKGIGKIQTSLNSQFATERANLTGMAKKLQDDSANFEKNKSVMSKADVAKKEEALRDEANKVQNAQNQYQQKFMQAQQEAMKKFVDVIRSAATAVAQKQNLDAIFIDNSVLYAKDSKDVTSDVLDRMQ